MGVAITVSVPERAEIGAEIDFAVLVSSPSPRSIDRVEIVFACEVAYFHGESYVRRRIFEAARPVEGPLDVGPAPRRFSERLRIPDDLPPSRPGGAFSVRYVVEARAEVPWWFDARAHEVIEVVTPPVPRPSPEPAHGSSANDPGALFAELTVDDVHLAPGDVVTGAFALGNVAGHRLDGATVTLVAWAEDGEVRLGEGLETVFRSITNARDGSVVGFSLKLPETMAVATECERVRFGNDLLLRIDGSTTQVRLPLDVGPYRERREAEERGAPRIGTERWRAGWAELAVDGLALHPKRLRLEGTLAPGVEAQVEARGSGLVADVRWEAFGIELEVAPRHLFHRGSLDAFAHHPHLAISGRCAEQVVDALTPALMRALTPFAEVEVGDAEAKLGASGAAHDAAALAAFLAALRTFALEIAAADRRIRAPPAAGGCDPAWTRFANGAGGRLRLGRLAVMGAEIDGEHVDIETRFDGPLPSRTRIVLRVDPQLSVEAKRGAREAPGIAAVVEAARKVVVARAEGAPAFAGPEVMVARRRIVAELGGFLRDPAGARSVVSAMLVLARDLRGEREGGPYR